MLYQAYQNHVDMTEPWRTGAGNAISLINRLPLSASDKFLRRLAAAFELISRSKLTYARPAYGIDSVMSGNREYEVIEKVEYATPFGSLLHFIKDGAPAQPGFCWSRRCPAISRRCCATPSRRCCRITTSTSPTGTIRATSRSTPASSVSTITPST